MPEVLVMSPSHTNPSFWNCSVCRLSEALSSRGTRLRSALSKRTLSGMTDSMNDLKSGAATQNSSAASKGA